MLRSVFGMDPGVSGGMTWLLIDGDAIEAVESIAFKKLTRRDCWDWICDRVELNSFGFIEKVSPMPAFDPKTKKPRSMGAKSAFTFGGSFERCECLLTFAGTRYELVRPIEWQKTVGLFYPKGSSQTEKKRMGKGKAQELFPDVGFKITNALADSLLIAYAAFKEG